MQILKSQWEKGDFLSDKMGNRSPSNRSDLAGRHEGSERTEANIHELEAHSGAM